jgi:hypothetical protein
MGDYRQVGRGEKGSIIHNRRDTFSAADMQRLGWTNSPKAALRTVQHSRGGEMVRNFRPIERGRLEKLYPSLNRTASSAPPVAFPAL